MEAIYFLLGDSAYFVGQKINEIKITSNIDPFNIVKYDASEIDMNEIIQEITTATLFSDLKMVIIENINEFTKKDVTDLKQFMKYLENPSSDVILILTATSIDKEHPLFNHLEKYTYIDYIKSIDHDKLPEFVKSRFMEDDYLIDNQATLELINRTQGDVLLLIEEINKLKMYTLNEKRISKLEVETIVSRSLEDNIFSFSSAYLRGETKVFMSIYDDLLENRMQVGTLFNHLFQTVYLIYLTQNLIKQGLNQEQIANYLNISSGRAYYVIKEAKEQNKKRIEKTIKDLAKLDVLIKTGLQDEKLGFELMLLGNLK